MAYVLKPEEHRTLIIYNGQQVGFIASDLAKTEWFAIVVIDNKGTVIPGFHESQEEAFRAFKKYRRTGRRENER